MDTRASSALRPRAARSRSSSRSRGPPSTGLRRFGVAMELLGPILKLSTSLSKQETNPLREGLVFRCPVTGTSGAPDSLPMAALDMNEHHPRERMDEWEEQKYELSAEMDALKMWRYDMIKRGFDHGFTGDGRLTPIIVTSLLGIGETILNMIDPAFLKEPPPDNVNLAIYFESLEKTVKKARQTADLEFEDGLQTSNNPADNTRSKAQAIAEDNQDVLAALRDDIKRLQGLMKIIVGLNTLGKSPRNAR